MLKIQTIGGDPKLKEIITKTEAPNCIFIVYEAGSAGTSYMVTAFRTVIYDIKKK